MNDQGFISFRDPDGFCCELKNRIIRCVRPEASPRIEDFLSSLFYKSLVETGRVQASRILKGDERKSVLALLPPGVAEGSLIIEHEAVFFPGYSHEWCREAHFEAGLRTLELQRLALAAGLTLKDATPNNILHRGTSPVFVDVTSFQSFQPENPLWLAHGQFVRTFLLPLLAGLKTGLPATEPLLQRGDGIEPEEVYRRFTLWRLMGPVSFFYVTLPTWFGRWSGSRTAGLNRKPGRTDPERAKFMAETILRRLEKTFVKLRPASAARSKWAVYMENHSYPGGAFAAKERFVRETLAGLKPRSVLDVGCNTGHFSRMAAESGALVVGIDQDEAALDQAWLVSRRTGERCLPLRVDFSRPTPGAGWRNSEQKPFLDRARNRFDTVMMLAATHHLVLSSGIPTAEIFRLLHELGARTLLIERVGSADPMARSISRNREHLLPSLDAASFEQALSPWFLLERKADLPGMERSLYFLTVKEWAA